jgi:hypothetical protein
MMKNRSRRPGPSSGAVTTPAIVTGIMSVVPAFVITARLSGG